MIVLQYVLISLIQIARAQFPEHIDLKKVGEIIFDNKKYDVLKPTVHKITDHFEDFMLRSENINKNEKIFIDDNGFRHFWSGMGRKYSNLRKTDVSLYEINKNLQSGVSEAVDKNTDLKNVEEDSNNTTDADVEDTTKVGVKRKPIRPKTSEEEEEEEKKKKETEKMLRESLGGKKASGKTVAITSFFCPFFGVIKMTAFID